MHDNTPLGKKALLVGVQTPGVTAVDHEASLHELGRLAQTLGYEVIGSLSQKRYSTNGSLVLGEGKLRELAEWTGGSGIVASAVEIKMTKARERFGKVETRDAFADELEEEKEAEEAATEFDAKKYSEILSGGKTSDPIRTESSSDQDRAGSDDVDADADDDNEDANEDANEDTDPDGDAAAGDHSDSGPRIQPHVVIFDCDLTPSQLRNLESATGVTVLDRTGVIIEIFSRHARTRAARLQVEIARLKYTAPRIRETGSDVQEGGGGKGAGETSLELDRRKIRDRLKELRVELESVQSEHDVRRARRNDVNCVALVGYTNAGKSSLMRAMTGSEIYVADKLFATLDTTVRPVIPETTPRILLSDTVGFIKKLPHDLVASFRSTLDEALNANLLLYIVDAADPTFRAQLEVTKTVLGEIGATDTESRLILNKRDRLTPGQIAELKKEFPDAIMISTRDMEDLKKLRVTLMEFFEGDMVEEDVFVGYTVQGAIGEIRAGMRVLSENFDGQGVTLRVRAKPEQLARLRQKFDLSGTSRD